MAAGRVRAAELYIDAEPGSDQNVLPRLYAFADTTSPDANTLRLYPCPTDPQEELRLTWDVPRRTITRDQLALALQQNAVEPEPERTP